MASIKAHPESGQYHLRFRFAGRGYRRSLKTGNRREAEAALARAEETMLLIRRGRIEVPKQADIVEFLFSDGKIAQPPQIHHALARGLTVRLSLGAERRFLFGPASLAAAMRNFASRRSITKVFLLPGDVGFVMRRMVDGFGSQVKI